ncbi:hypothetical protein C7S18_03780 [Ahniella affigens]|uniref:NAD-dependent epimerase/dehydratase domain-containing protein n=1 Tax=Ahniella affigens TaxID=2021234 RepID=A0A2P1PND4_9GAMM|nr:NAD(P)-dependent oxidoreductase [Ahniella affigens]AVP96363.1 hypothetical protein C7S18_03780 [Ahniella affigens]
MNILLTGGSGFIGTHLCRALLDAGHGIRILDLRSSVSFPDSCLLGDIRDANLVEQALRDVDLVIHLAAVHADDVSPLHLYAETNVDGTRVLLDAMRAANVVRLLHFSSVSVYGAGPAVESDLDPKPLNEYGRSKLAAEQLIVAWQAEQPTVRSARVLRPSVVYGPGHHGNMKRLIDELDRPRMRAIGSGQQVKAVAFVGNVVAASLFDLAELPGCRIHNVADLPPIPMHEWMRLIRIELGRDPARQIRLPEMPAYLLGFLAQTWAHLCRQKPTISVDRVRKFLASTPVDASLLARLGYLAPYSHQQGLRATIAARQRTEQP